MQPEISISESKSTTGSENWMNIFIERTELLGLGLMISGIANTNPLIRVINHGLLLGRVSKCFPHHLAFYLIKQT